ncbi:MAG: sigma-70 family RNA polymerase sigma factor [Actinomycetota bacterium]|nr:sigma-70 family RNA polymerase sigma factor [Actinomycetota bacterium]
MSYDVCGDHLSGIAQIPLLGRDQLHAAAGTFQRGEAARRRLTEAEVPAADVMALREAVRAGDQAKHLLVTSNLRLVVSVARRFGGAHPVPLADLVQEGVIGLIRAVEKFDHTRGTTFSTYATWWIRQAIGRALAEQGRIVRVPRHVNQKLSNCMRTRGELRVELGREPHRHELADALGVDEAEVAVLLRCAAPAKALHLVEEQAERGDEAVGHAEQQHLQELLAAALKRLPASHRNLLFERVGWDGRQPRSLRELADEHGVSRGMVKRMELDAHEMLRRSPQVEALDEWFNC